MPTGGSPRRGKIVGEVLDEDVRPQVEIGGTGRCSGIGQLVEELGLGLRLSTESVPLSEPFVSPTTGAAAST
jgi:phosphoribosylformylglycinamidine (FGAM) synthase-like enzyme